MPSVATSDAFAARLPALGVGKGTGRAACASSARCPPPVPVKVLRRLLRDLPCG